MFETVPTNTEPPKNNTAIPSSITKANFDTILKKDQQTVDMFKRASLTTAQKLLLISITVLIIGGMAVGGFFLYLRLKPFDYVPNNKTSNNADIFSNTSFSDKDTDADGLSDDLEINRYKTDPLKADTDGDGYVDGFEEVDRGYDPNGPGKLITNQ